MFTRAAQQNLMDWYRDHRRVLPWRETRDPYRIMVSEIMLQQTQVDRVVPKYLDFLKLFPTLEALADAPASEVIRAWAGLGYNRRALNLQRACRIVVDDYFGTMPDNVQELQKLPGIGPYTAGAIACFAFGRDVGFVDTNIRRVLHRVSVGPELPEPLLSTREIADLASDLVPVGCGYTWNQALIELGALICRSRQTDCVECPLALNCVARPDIEQALATHPRRTDRSAQPKFETTSRYFRGQIVKLLLPEHSGLQADELARQILPDVEEDNWVLEHIESLLKDGLIVEASYSRSIQRSQLGEDQPRPYDLAPLNRRYRLPD